MAEGCVMLKDPSLGKGYCILVLENCSGSLGDHMLVYVIKSKMVYFRENFRKGLEDVLWWMVCHS